MLSVTKVIVYLLTLFFIPNSNSFVLKSPRNAVSYRTTKLQMATAAKFLAVTSLAVSISLPSVGNLIEVIINDKH